MKKLNSRKLANIERKIAEAIRVVKDLTYVPGHSAFIDLDVSNMSVDRTFPNRYYPHLSIPVKLGLYGEVFLYPDRLERVRKIIKSRSSQLVYWSADNFYVSFYFD